MCILERQCADAPLVQVSLSELYDDLTSPKLKLVLFGETHTDPGAVHVEKLVYEKMASSGRVALGLEFIESDKRELVRNFLKNDDDHRLLFKTTEEAERYGPLVRAAKATSNEVVAANAPRRLVSKVSKNGVACLSSLPPRDLELLPPLPYASQPISPGYDERLRRIWNLEQSEERRNNLVAAQCLWDASMAYSLLDHLRAHPKEAIMLVCGRFHVEFFLGIVDHVEHLLDHDESFSDLSLLRDEFRLVVSIPLDDHTFDTQRAKGWHDLRHEEAISTLADFIVFTRKSAFDDSLTNSLNVTHLTTNAEKQEAGPCTPTLYHDDCRVSDDASSQVLSSCLHE